MCDCGFLHIDVAAVTASHNAHALTCKKYSEAPPQCPVPTFQPTSNTKIQRRKRGNTTHLETSGYAWVTRWMAKHKTWPENTYPWVQWAMTYHPKSEFIWYAGSTADTVATRAADLTMRAARTRDDFDTKRAAWWTAHARALLPLNNRAFKPVHTDVCVMCFCLCMCVLMFICVYLC